MSAEDESRAGSAHCRVEIRPAWSHFYKEARDASLFEERREEPGAPFFIARRVLARLSDQLAKQLERFFIVDRLEHATLAS
jgi:hypothetical protein